MARQQFTDRRSEALTVRRALAEAGISARVGHDRGTAWGWLSITIGDLTQYGPHDGDGMLHGCAVGCVRCDRRRALDSLVHAIAMGVTGRSGPYQGNISVEWQNPWSKAKGEIKLVHRWNGEAVDVERIVAKYRPEAAQHRAEGAGQ